MMSRRTENYPAAGVEQKKSWSRGAIPKMLHCTFRASCIATGRPAQQDLASATYIDVRLIAGALHAKGVAVLFTAAPVQIFTLVAWN
jgi:hypothetical protein